MSPLIRKRIIELFEKHRCVPGSPYDESHFLDYFLPNPKNKKDVVFTSFRNLHRYSAFIDDIQVEFCVYFSHRDRDTNYSIDRFVERVVTLQMSPKSSLASLRNAMSDVVGFDNFIKLVFFILVGALLLFIAHLRVAAVAVLIGSIVLTVWGVIKKAKMKKYRERLFEKIKKKEPN